MSAEIEKSLLDKVREFVANRNNAPIEHVDGVDITDDKGIRKVWAGYTKRNGMGERPLGKPDDEFTLFPSSSENKT